MTLIKRWNYKLGRNALRRESKLKREFKGLLFRGTSTLRKKGNETQTTEIFTADILGLDKGAGI